MPLRSVISIDVDDSSFDKFFAKFQQYQQQAAGMTPLNIGGGAGGGGRGARDGGGGGATVNVLKMLGVEAKKAQRITNDMRKDWDRISKASGLVARNVREIGSRIIHMAEGLTKFTGLMGLATGVATGFGFLGMDVLGRSASGYRRAATGLGTSIGGMRAFGLDFGRFVDPNAFMGGISQAMRDPTHSPVLGALGVRPEKGEETDTFAARALQRVQDLAKSTPENLLGTLLTSRRLTDLGVDLPTLMRLRNAPSGELGDQQRAFGRDRGAFNITPAQAKAWQDFTTSIERSRMSIETTFIVGLSPLAPALQHLGEAISKTLSAFLSKPELKQWIDQLADGIERFGKYIASDDFQKDVQSFITKVGDMAKAIGSFVEWVFDLIPALRPKSAPGTAGSPAASADPKGHTLPGTGTAFEGQDLWENPDGMILNPATGRRYKRLSNGSYQYIPDTQVGPSNDNQSGLRIPSGSGPNLDRDISHAAFIEKIMPLAEAASKQTGVAPSVIAAQAALESKWGRSAPGNNYFGIKGPGGGMAMTQEFIGGKMVSMPQSFAGYGSMGDSFQAYADFINRNPRYAGMKGASSIEAQIAALGRSGYATDPQYASKVAAVLKDIENFSKAWKRPTANDTHLTQLMNTARGAPNVAPQRQPSLNIHIHNETGGNAVMSAAQLAS
jgi:hypothetical protein